MLQGTMRDLRVTRIRNINATHTPRILSSPRRLPSNNEGAPMSKRNCATFAAVLCLVAAVMPAAAQEIAGSATTTARAMAKPPAAVTQAMLDAAAGDAKNWIHSNGSYEQHRLYPGSQINAGNVAKLRPAFVFQTAVLESMETAPIVVDGVMFLTTSFNHVYAIDAAT